MPAQREEVIMRRNVAPKEVPPYLGEFFLGTALEGRTCSICKATGSRRQSLQCGAVCLSRRQARNMVDLHETLRYFPTRDHIQQRSSQSGCIDWIVCCQEGDQGCFLAGAANAYSGIANTGLAQQHCLNGFQLNAHTVDFHLSITTALEYNSPVGSETRPVAAEKDSFVFLKPRRGLNKSRYRQLRAIEIAKADLRAADPDFTYYAGRNRMAILSYNPKSNPW